MNGFRLIGFCSERSLYSLFLLFYFSARDLVVVVLFYSLVPNFQTTITFCSLVGIQRNQRSRLRYDLVYPVKQLKHVLKSLKCELDQICIQTLFDHNLSFVAPFELILFATKLSDEAKFI